MSASGSASAVIIMVASFFVGWSPIVFGHLFVASLFTAAFLLAAVFPLVSAVVLLAFVFPGQLRPSGKAARDDELTESARQAF
jgi:uncharacterized membrane protein